MAQRTVSAQPGARAHADAITNRHPVLVRLENHRTGRVNIGVLGRIPSHPAQSRHASAAGRRTESARHRDLVPVIGRTRVAIEAPLALVRAAHIDHHKIVSIRVRARHAIGLQIPVRRAAEALEILIGRPRPGPAAARHRERRRPGRHRIAEKRLGQERTSDRPGSIGIHDLVMENRRAVPAGIAAPEEHILIAASPGALLRLEPARTIGQRSQRILSRQEQILEHLRITGRHDIDRASANRSRNRIGLSNHPGRKRVIRSQIIPGRLVIRADCIEPHARSDEFHQHIALAFAAQPLRHERRGGGLDTPARGQELNILLRQPHRVPDEIHLAGIAPNGERLLIPLQHLIPVHPVATQRRDRIKKYLIPAALGEIGLDPDRAIRIFIPLQHGEEVFLLHRQVDKPGKKLADIACSSRPVSFETGRRDLISSRHVSFVLFGC